MGGRTTICILTMALVISLSVVLAQNFTLCALYYKYDSVNTAYKLLAAEKYEIAPPPYVVTPAPYLKDKPFIPPNSASLAAKNKNPLNIKTLANGEEWEGQAGVDARGHAIFQSIEYGIRAAAFTLWAYEREHGVDTVDKLISRFSEATGEKHAVYSLFVCQKLGVANNEKISLISKMPALLRAMAKYESGLELPNELFVGYDVLGKIK